MSIGSNININEISSVVFVILVLTQVAAKPVIQSEKSIGRSDTITADPRYGDLKEKAERIVSVMNRNLSKKIRSLLGEIIYPVNEAYRNLPDDDCQEETSEKLFKLRNQTIKDLSESQLWQEVERKSQDMIVAVTRLAEDIQRAAQESLIFCMEKNRSYNVVCYINSQDEASDKFNSLERKVDQLSASAKQIYINDFQSFVQRSFNKNEFKAELEQIKSLCTESSYSSE